jgi:monoamine oxidase
VWAENDIGDMFGELIDTNHTSIQSLAKRYSLPLVDLLAAEPTGATETYHFFGKYYTYQQACTDFNAMFDALSKDLREAGYPTTYNRSRPGGIVLDNMSIYDWIETRVPGGHNSPLGALLDVAYVIEFGAETRDQSALNLIYLLGYGSRTSFNAYGTSDERYRIVGGIERVCQSMATELSWDSCIKLNQWMESIVKNTDGTFTLTFSSTSPIKTVTADIVLLAIPFAVLRTLDYSRAGFDALKTRAIQESGTGINGKLQLQFTERYWNKPGPWGNSSGSTFSDVGCQATWEATRGDPGTAAILVKFTGGNVTANANSRHPYSTITQSGVSADAQLFLTELEKIYPGISAKWNGKAVHSLAHLNKRWKLSYPYYRVGQYHVFADYERVPMGRVFFAGDHCSVDFQGWMEGAVRSGLEAGNNMATLARNI